MYCRLCTVSICACPCLHLHAEKYTHCEALTSTRPADAAEEHAAEQDEGAGLAVLDNMQARVEPAQLLEPVWELGGARCPLLVLQVQTRTIPMAKIACVLRSCIRPDHDRQGRPCKPERALDLQRVENTR